jgi:glutathione S-transferase
MRCYGDKPPEFLAKVPSGLLPVLEVDGQIITESALIARLLEEWYPQPALLPPQGSPEADRAQNLLRLERRMFSDWLQWLCNSWGGDAASANFIKTMDAVEAALGVTDGPYFLEDFSLVDITFAPFLERIVASLLYYKGLVMRGQGRWPNLENWFVAMEGRPSYLAFRSDHYTHCHDLPPQLGGCVSSPEAEPFAAAIDGSDANSWRLPLSNLSTTSLEAYSPGNDPPRDRLRAASKLVSNHIAVTRFALRGVGKPGARRVSAPLSDPTAVPGMEHEEAVDAALRHVAHALLLGTAAREGGYALRVEEEPGLPGSVGEAGIGAYVPASPVVGSLRYLRDRVGVPRDLPLPAARELRAHLNWVIDAVLA